MLCLASATNAARKRDELFLHQVGRSLDEGVTVTTIRMVFDGVTVAVTVASLVGVGVALASRVAAC